jgi:indolepyruvate ferredoxin oxidoreductase alpha subunit
MVGRVFGKRTVYCNDIGCYTLGYGEPLHACDTVLCMGSSITQASGIARMTGRRTVAYIGDSTFFHSGLPALANAVQADDEITVVVLNNYITAMTGFQPSLSTGGWPPKERPDPASSGSGGDAAPHPIEQAAWGLGVQDVFSVNPFEEEVTLAALRKARAGSGVNVVVCHAPCAVNYRRVTRGRKRTPYAINPELCDACSLCVRALGCPAILVIDGQYSIDPDLCDGCELCARLCQRDAIQPAVSERV